MSKLIHTGVVGFGLSGKVFHAPFIHTHKGFHLSSVVERNHQYAKEIYPYISVVNDYADLLKDDCIELIVITTPNIFHYSMAKECLLAGKHVVIEKPFTPSSREADELIELSNCIAKRIFVYQNRRWDGDFLTIKKLIDEEVLGEINYYEAHFDRFSPELKEHAWRDKKDPGGGILYDLGPHLIDQALVLFGMPEGVRAELKLERPGSEVDDCFELEMFYPNNKIVLNAGMMVKKIGPRFIIEGADANFTKHGIDPQEACLKEGKMPEGEIWGAENPEFFGKLELLNGAEEKIKPIPTEHGNYMGFYDNVFDVINNNKDIMVRAEEARDVIFIIEKAIESHQNKCVIKINNTI